MNFLSTTFAIIIFIIFLLLLIYYTLDDDKYRANYQRKLKKSSGIYDKYAKSALEDISRIKNKTADDLYYQALIIDKYKNCGKLGRKTKYRKTQSELNDEKELQSIYLNLAKKINIESRRKQTQNNTRQNPQTVNNRQQLDPQQNNRIHNGIAQNRQNQQNDNYDHIFYVNLIDDFAERDLNQALINLANDAKNRENLTKLANIEKTAKSKTDAVVNFYAESAQTVANDQQNSHDTAVNKGLRQKYMAIQKDRPIITDTIDDIINYCRISGLSHVSNDMRNDAIDAITHISNYNEYVISVADYEKNVLLAVWNRYKLPINSGNGENIKNACIHALASCKETGTICCPNGRVSRILGSLDAVDRDKSLPTIATIDLYRQMILNRASKAFTALLAEYKNSQNELERELAESYETRNSADPDEITKKRFIEKYREKIEKIVDEYKEYIGDVHAKQITDECLIVI